MKKALIILPFIFLGFGWFCYDIGYHAGMISSNVGMMINDIRPSVIRKINHDAAVFRKKATISALGIEPRDKNEDEKHDVVDTKSL